MKNGDIPFPWLWGIFAKEVVPIVQLDWYQRLSSNCWHMSIYVKADLHPFHSLSKCLVWTHLTTHVSTPRPSSIRTTSCWKTCDTGSSGHGVLNKWKLKGCSTLTFCVFILRWPIYGNICCFIHFRSLHTKKMHLTCNKHIHRNFNEWSFGRENLNFHQHTNLPIPSYKQFQTRPLLRRLHLQDPKLSGIYTKGHSRRAMNVWLEFRNRCLS